MQREGGRLGLGMSVWSLRLGVCVCVSARAYTHKFFFVSVLSQLNNDK